jgi:GxxExxY protein
MKTPFGFWKPMLGLEKILATEPINAVTSSILQAAIKVHAALGPGVLESSYEECLQYEMNKAGLYIERQLALPLLYQEVKLDLGYRVDFRIERSVIVEIKACDGFHDVHTAQVLIYLKLSKCKVGLLINFNVPRLKQGIKRLIL